jgi:hypothetical protein
MDDDHQDEADDHDRWSHGFPSIRLQCQNGTDLGQIPDH